MARKEEILNKAIELVDEKYCNVGIKTTHEASVAACQEIAEWADKTAWKPADGDNLPEIDREVIALVEENGHYKVVFAHRPPEHWNGKNILTDEVTCYIPKRYDKGEWNQPNVKWWLDLELPKIEE